VIRSFADKLTAALFAGHYLKAIPGDVAKRARTKLLIVDHAMTLADLLVPPGNRLEVLRGERAGQHSIRVNDQWRICFIWRDGDAHEVEFCDYHD
jgi:proteic killer suppression protein